MREVMWGEVTSVSPVEVRFAGDSADVPVALKADGLTLSTNDKVLLVKAGAVGGWVVVAKLVAA